MSSLVKAGRSHLLRLLQQRRLVQNGTSASCRAGMNSSNNLQSLSISTVSNPRTETRQVIPSRCIAATSMIYQASAEPAYLCTPCSQPQLSSILETFSSHIHCAVKTSNGKLRQSDVRNHRCFTGYDVGPAGGSTAGRDLRSGSRDCCLICCDMLTTVDVPVTNRLLQQSGRL